VNKYIPKTKESVVTSVAVALIVMFLSAGFKMYTTQQLHAQTIETHIKKEAHANTRQNQIDVVRTRVDIHERKQAHPKAAESLTHIREQLAAQKTDINNIKDDMRSVLQLLRNGPRPR
jgi:type I site-specific restriction endonuclease